MNHHHLATSNTGENDDAMQRPAPDIGSKTPVNAASRTSCDLCKRMKIKCERQGQSCIHCVARNASCETTIVPRKKQAKRYNLLAFVDGCDVANQTISGKNLVDVENRLKRLESVLAASGIGARSHLEDEQALAENIDTQNDVTDRLSNLIIDDQGDSHFIGAASGFSLFSPQGLQWISNRTGSNDLAQYISSLSKKHDVPWPFPNSELWHSIPIGEREPLPSREVADPWVKCFFETFNSVFPLYDREVFYRHFELQYSGRPTGGIAWYASLNVAFSIGGLIWKGHSGLKTAKTGLSMDEMMKEQCWKYFRNACSCVVDIMFKNTSLMAVQAICGIAFIQQTTLDPQPFYILTAAAGRLAHAIGLHRKLDDFGLSQSEICQRRNVFWIVYFMDKSIALRVGHPSVMVDDDIGVDLPEQQNLTNCLDGTKRFDIFRSQAQLSLLESRIYTELYTVRSRTRSDFDRLKSVGQLDKELQDWREALPVEIRPGLPIQCSEEQLVPVVLLQFAYLNSLATVHRVSIHHGSWTNDGKMNSGSSPHDHHLNPRVYASHSICLMAARSSIQLLQYINLVGNTPHNNLIWMAMYYPLSGFLTLFANTLQHPQDSYVASDLKLMDLVRSFISPVTSRHNPFSCASSVNIFTLLSEVATKFVEKSNRESGKHTKRGHDMNHSLQGKNKNPTGKGEESEHAVDSAAARPSMPRETAVHASTSIKPPPTLATNPTFDQPLIANPHDQRDVQDQEFHGNSYPFVNPFENNDSMLYSDMGLGVPHFSENFEWDLANLWNTDFGFAQGF